jgi:integrase
MKLTVASLASLEVPAGKSDHIEFDEAMPGFGIRIRAGAKGEHRTFIAQYKIGAKHRRINLGNVAKVSLDDARKEARKIFGKVANGQDPAAQKTVAKAEASKTLDAIIAHYLEARKGGKKIRGRHYDGVKHQLETLWKPLHRLTLGAVSRAAIAAQLNTIAKERGPVAANRARTTLSAMFRWAIGEGLCDANPVIGTNKKEENGPRERALSDTEAAAVWIATSENHFGRIVRLLMLTGCRRDEIGSLRWSEIDVNARAITLPPSRTKNGKEHIVPLAESALEILKAIPRREGRDYVFGIRGGGFGNWSQAKTALDKSVELKEPWTLHDLRRTVRTGLGMLGILPHVAEAVLNHIPAKLIRTYDRNTYAAEKKAALEQWANHLAVAIAQASGANVTSLRKAKE